MYLALPKPLQNLLGALHAHPGKDEHELRVVLNDVMCALSLFGVRDKTLKSVRKALLLVGPKSEAASDAAFDLFEALREQDLDMNEEAGGFANLFESAMAEGEICAQGQLSFDGLGW